MDKVCSWTVMEDGKVKVNQVGGSIHEDFPKLLNQVVNDIQNAKGNWYGILEIFSDGTQSLTLKNVQ